MIFESRVPPKARYAYAMDTWSGSIGNIALGLTMPFVSVIALATLDASKLEMSILTATPVAGSLLSLLWARIMEGRRKMPFMVGAILLSRSLLLLTFMATTSPRFVALVSFVYILGSTSGPAYSALMKEMYPDGDRARIMAYVRVIAQSVSMIATFVAGHWLIPKLGYKPVFVVAGVFGVISPLIFRVIPTSEASGDADVSHWEFFSDSVNILRHDLGFRWFCGGIFMFGFANFMCVPLYEMYKVNVLGVRELWASIYSNVVALMAIAGYFYWGSFVDRQTPVRTIAITTLIWTSIPLLFCVATQAWMLLPVMIIMGAVSAAIDLSYFNGVLYFAPEEKVTQYQAVFATLVGVRGLVAPFVGTTLLHWMPMKVIFVISAAMTLCGYFVLVAGMRKHGKPQAAEVHST